MKAYTARSEQHFDKRPADRYIIAGTIELFKHMANGLARRKGHYMSVWPCRTLRWILVSLIVGGADLSASAARISAENTNPVSITSYVNPLVGTDTAGRTFPGADVPFGMVQWSPDTTSWSPSGYSYSDSAIRGFSLTHLSGTGCSIYQDIPFMPFVGPLNGSPATNPSAYTSSFSHADEQAVPGYYGVQLGSGVQVGLTVTPRTGFGMFTYPASTGARMLINVGGSANGNGAASFVQIMTNTDEIVGSASSGGFCNRATPYTIYFAAQFSQPFSDIGTWNGAQVAAGSSASQGAQSGAYVTFDTTQDPVVLVKVGVSFVSIQNAQTNLQAEDPNPLSSAGFTAVRSAAEAAWSAMLGHITISGGTDAEKQTFYTALYHALLQPNVFGDVNGQYIGFDNQIHDTQAYTQYANYSEWDIYRTEIPLLALLAPQQTSDMMQSLVADAQQSGGLPRWSVANDNADVMVGDPADAIIAGAYAFGATHFDTAAALQAMIQGAMQQGTSSDGYTERPALDLYESFGFIPQDRDSWFPAATTLEYTSDDFSTAQFAQALGDTNTYAALMRRAQNWQNLYNPATGYSEPRQSDGTFPATFDPGSGDGFIEGSSAQYTWMAPYNLHALFNAMGGNQQVAGRLDSFFNQLNAGPSAPYAWLGNEPSLSAPWAYDFAGEPWRTQAVVRQAETQLFTPSFDGLPGNDDLGTTSAWYVWAALGLYPEIPGVSDLVLSSPLFPQITLHLANGHDVTIVAPAASDTTPYVQALTVNGQPYAKPWLSLATFADGATLQYTLSSSPNTSWGIAASDAPPSFDSGEAPGLNFVSPSGVMTVTAGSRQTFQLLVSNVTDAPLVVQWRAAVPTGLQVESPSGNLSIPSASTQSQMLALSVAPNTAPGRYVVPFQVQATSSSQGSGMALPSTPLQIIVPPSDTPEPTAAPTPASTATPTPTATPTAIATATSTPIPTTTAPPSPTAMITSGLPTSVGVPSATAACALSAGAATAITCGPPTPMVITGTVSPPPTATRTHITHPAIVTLKVHLSAHTLRPGDSFQMDVSYARGAFVRVALSDARQRPTVITRRADARGHLNIRLRAPLATLPHGHGTALLRISAVAGTHSAADSIRLMLSDMILTASALRTRSCARILMVHVAYIAAAHVRIDVTLSGRRWYQAVLLTGRDGLLRDRKVALPRLTQERHAMKIIITASGWSRGMRQTEQVRIIQSAKDTCSARTARHTTL